MRRLLAAPLLLALLVGPAGRPAGAQTDPSARVELSLVSQTSVATPRSPFRFEVQARHLSGPPLPDLSVSLWVYNPADSRSAFQAGLTGEPPTAPLLVLPTGRPQTLEPGEEIQFQGRRRLTELAAREANALYPIKIQLESAGVAVTAIRSGLLFIEERPLVPLNLSLIFVLDPDLRVSPDGTLLGDALEQAIRPGGRVDAIVSSLEAEPARSTLVIAPRLLESLQRMRSG